MLSQEKLLEFTDWCQNHITGNEKGEAQIFHDRFFQGLCPPTWLDLGGKPESRNRKADYAGGSAAFSTLVESSS